MDRPRVDRIEGIPPAIALGQSNQVRSSRSTVGTVTEIADHLKLIFPRLAQLTCPDCCEPIKPWTPHSILSELIKNHPNQEAWFLFRIPFPQKTPADEAAAFLARQGFRRALLDGKPHRLDEPTGLEALAQALKQTPPEQNLLVHVIQDRLTLSRSSQSRLIEAITSCLKYGRGVAAISLVQNPPILISTRIATTAHAINVISTSPRPPSFRSIIPSALAQLAADLVESSKLMNLWLSQTAPSLSPGAS